MKRIILLVLLLAVGLTTQAQQKKPLSHRHEVSVGVAAIPITLPYDLLNMSVDCCGSRTFGDLNNHKRIRLPAFNAIYCYRFSRLFTLQSIVSYTGMIKPYEYLYTGKTVISERFSQLTILPVARFNWSRDGRLVTLYSSIGLGLAISWVTNIDGEKGDKSGWGFPTFHFNPIGISIGRKLYGFAELQASSIGTLHIGMGYRFNYKK